MLGIRGVCRRTLPLSSSDWITLASGSALWALALYIPLSGPLGRLEAELSGTGLSESLQTTILVLSSLLLALAVLLRGKAKREEQALLRQYPNYAAYQQRVPAFFPGF